MYPKKLRLPIDKKKKNWLESFSSPYFLLKSGKNLEGHNRFAIIIANHAVKSSVRRHFWKRAIADELQKLPNAGKDILIIVSPKVEGITKKVLKEELNKVFKKLAGQRAKEPKS